MRTTIELLELVRECIREHEDPGCCDAIYRMGKVKLLSYDERKFLYSYFISHRPSQGSKFYRKSMQGRAYFFGVGATQIRIDWLNHLIKKERSKL